MWFKVLVSTACVAVIAASGVVIWQGAGLTSTAQAQGGDVTRADICRIARDLLIASDFGFSILPPTAEQSTKFQLQMCNGEENWPPPPYPQ